MNEILEFSCISGTYWNTQKMGLNTTTGVLFHNRHGDDITTALQNVCPEKAAVGVFPTQKQNILL